MQQERVQAHCGSRDHHWPPRCWRLANHHQTGAADKPSKRAANVLVSLTQAFGLQGRGYRPARVEHLGPTAARADEGEGALRVGVATNGVQKIARRATHQDCEPAAAPSNLMLPSGTYAKTLKVMRRENLNRCAGRDHLSLWRAMRRPISRRRSSRVATIC